MLFPAVLVLFGVLLLTGQSTQDRCGKPYLGQKVIGGHNASPGQVPWQVSLRVTHPSFGVINHFCGGVIVSRSWVLTAAHCIVTPKGILAQPSYWKIRAGEHRLNERDGSERVYAVSHVVYNYGFSGYNNDIGMLRVREPFVFNQFVMPACLPRANENFVGQVCEASGWGKVDSHTKVSNTLQLVRVKIFRAEVCNSAYSRQFGIRVTNKHVCSGTLEGGKGTCQGDSGGPLTCYKGGVGYITGLTSFGSNCAKPGFPDVYTRVQSYLPWIRMNMQQLP